MQARRTLTSRPSCVFNLTVSPSVIEITVASSPGVVDARTQSPPITIRPMTAIFSRGIV